MFESRGAKDVSKVSDVTIETYNGQERVTQDPQQNLLEVKISDNGSYFQLFRKLDTKDKIDSKIICGQIQELNWLGKSSLYSQFDKKGKWKMRTQKDCVIIDVESHS